MDRSLFSLPFLCCCQHPTSSKLSLSTILASLMAFEQQAARSGFGIITHIFALFLKARDTLKSEVKRNFPWVIKGMDVCLDGLQRWKDSLSGSLQKKHAQPWHHLVARSLESGITLPPAVWPRASYSTSVCLSIFLCKNEDNTVPTS